MSPDKQVQEGIGSGFTTKQKLMAVGVVVILLIVIWQVVDLFGGGSGESPPAPIQNGATKPPTQMTATMPGTPANPSAPAVGGQAPTGVGQPPAIIQPQPAPIQREQTLSGTDLLRNQQEEQKKYLASVNELQMLKLQRDIAETNQGIAAAKLATATTEQNINNLLTKPMPAPVPVGEYANRLAAPTAAGMPSGVPGTAPPPEVPANEAAYIVISVSMQLNRWTAVLGYQGKLYNVMIGDVLPVDGWTVASITKEGVILKKDDVKRKISLVPVI
jgi:type IV pilus biogenesis protein PilP